MGAIQRADLVERLLMGHLVYWRGITKPERIHRLLQGHECSMRKFPWLNS